MRADGEQFPLSPNVVVFQPLAAPLCCRLVPAVLAPSELTNKEFPDINRQQALFGRSFTQRRPCSLNSEELRLKNTGRYRVLDAASV